MGLGEDLGEGLKGIWGFFRFWGGGAPQWGSNLGKGPLWIGELLGALPRFLGGFIPKLGEEGWVLYWGIGRGRGSLDISGSLGGL